MTNKTTKRIAIFEYTSLGNLSCLAGTQTVREYDDDTDLIRTSEWIDVDFTPIPIDDVMPEILESLQREEDMENEKHNIAIATIQRKRQELLAITHEPVTQL